MTSTSKITCNFIIFFYSAFNSAFVANVTTFFLSKSVLFMNPAKADLLINRFVLPFHQEFDL